MASWASLDPDYSSPPLLIASLQSYVAIGTCIEVGNSVFRLLRKNEEHNLLGNRLVPLSECTRISALPSRNGAGKTYREVVQTREIESISSKAAVEIVLVQTTKQLELNKIGNASTFVRHIRYRDDGSEIDKWNDFPCCSAKYNLIDCSTVRFIYEGLSCLADVIGSILNKRQHRECDRSTTHMNPACWNFVKRKFATTRIERSPQLTTKRKQLEEGFVQRLYCCKRQGEYLRLSTKSELDELANLLGPTAVCGIQRQPKKEPWVLGSEGRVNIVHSTIETREDYNLSGDWIQRTQSPGIDIFSDGHVARVYVRLRFLIIREGDHWPSSYLAKCAVFGLCQEIKRIGTSPTLFEGAQYEDDVDDCIYEVLRYDPSEMMAVWFFVQMTILKKK